MSNTENPPLVDVLKNKNIALVAMVGFCAAVEFAITTYFVLFLKESLEFPVVTAGFLLALLEGGGALGKPMLGFISDRFLNRSRKKAYLLITTTWCLASILMAFFHKSEPVWMLIVVCVIAGASTIGWSGIHFTFIAELRGGNAWSEERQESVRLSWDLARWSGCPLLGKLSILPAVTELHGLPLRFWEWWHRLCCCWFVKHRDEVV